MICIPAASAKAAPRWISWYKWLDGDTLSDLSDSEAEGRDASEIVRERGEGRKIRLRRLRVRVCRRQWGRCSG